MFMLTHFSQFSAAGFPPHVLRPDLTVILFCFIVLLETGIILLFSPYKIPLRIRLQLIWGVPLANLATSCLFAPSSIGIYKSMSGYITPLILVPAEAVWIADPSEGVNYFNLLVTFLLFVVIFGLLSVWVENRLLHCVTQSSENKIWKSIWLANGASYLSLFAWSCWIGIKGSRKYSGDFDDHFDEYVSKLLTSTEASQFQKLTWLLFFLGLGIAIFMIIIGVIVAGIVRVENDIIQIILSPENISIAKALSSILLVNLLVWLPFYGVLIGFIILLLITFYFMNQSLLEPVKTAD